MRLSKFIFLLLLFPALVFARGDYYKGVSVAPDFCTSCSGEADADIICEDFDGSETITNDGTTAACTGWTATEVGVGVVTTAAHSGTLACTDKGTYALNFSGDSDDFANVERTFTAVNTFENIFYFNYVSNTIVTGGTNKEVTFYRLRRSSSNKLHLQIQKRDADQSIDLQIGYANAGMQWAQYNANLALDTWYQFEVEWINGTSLNIWLNDVLIFDVVVDAVAIDEVWFGINGGDANGSSNVMQIDNIKLDDDTMPSPCEGG